MLGAGLIAYLIGLVIRIPLIRIIGDKGLGFFAPSMEIFALISTVLCYGISRAVAILVKYRVKKRSVFYVGIQRTGNAICFFLFRIYRPDIYTGI